MNFILCGLPKSGKTSVGKLLAERLNTPFIDTDRVIESLDGRGLTCREIFQVEGGSFFRELEKQALLSLNSLESSVIALGGGSLDTPLNRKVVKSLGKLIYLKTPLKTIWERLLADGLPAYLPIKSPKKTFYAIAKRRIILFEEMADTIIESEEDKWQVTRLAKLLESRRGANLMENALES